MKTKKLSSSLPLSLYSYIYNLKKKRRKMLSIQLSELWMQINKFTMQKRAT